MIDQMTLRRDLLEALFCHGPSNGYELAELAGASPFWTRSILRALKRDRLVRDYLDPYAHTWELTDHGRRAAFKARQLDLTNAT